jgi:hypothetical protein
MLATFQQIGVVRPVLEAPLLALSVAAWLSLSTSALAEPSPAESSGASDLLWLGGALGFILVVLLALGALSSGFFGVSSRSERRS